MDLIGHRNTKSQIATALASAQERNRELPHMLFSGHPGCGKTSMAKEVAKLYRADFLSLAPELLKGYKDVAKVIEQLNHEGYDDKGNRIGKIRPTILFFDEIHNMPLGGQEAMGIAMENFTLETGKPNKLFWVPYFCLVGATTLAGNLSRPFLDRFKFDFVFQPYSFEESIEIIRMHSDNLLIKQSGIGITNAAIRQIALRGRGVPRVMVRYIERIRDMAIGKGSRLVTENLALITFKELGIDAKGFNQTEIKILRCLYNNDVPVGLDNLAIITSESSKTIKDAVEPFLIKQGMILRTGSGRVITRLGREYLEEQGYAGSQSGKQTIASGYVRT